MRALGKYLLRSRSHVTLTVLLFAIISVYFLPMFWCASIVIALATLRNGPKEGLALTCWACLPVMAFVLAQHVDTSAVALVLNYVLMFSLASLLYRFSSWNFLLEFSVFIGFLMVLLLNNYATDLIQAWSITVTTLVTNLEQTKDIVLDLEQKAYFIQILTMLAVGLLVLQVLISNVVALLLARAWQASLFNPGGLAEEFKKIRASKWVSLAVILTSLLCILDYRMAFEFLPVLFLPHLVGAVSLVHHLADKNPNKQIFLGIFYITALIAASIVMPVLILVGFIDSFYDYRKANKTVV